MISGRRWLVGLCCVLGGLFALGFVGAPAGAAELGVAVKGAALRGTALHLTVTVEAPAALPVEVLVGDRVVERLELVAGETEVRIADPGIAGPVETVTVRSGEISASTQVRTLTAWLSVLPPLAAIVLALLFRDVLVSLFSGIFLGALFLNGWDPLAAFGRTIDTYIATAPTDPDRAKILIFSALLGAMVGVMGKSGGTLGIVERLGPLATSPRRGQFAAWAMGILVFFDDYANTLIVGSTMRPITDRLRISREKLAYIVDSTAAPVASLFPISTWIGFEVGLLASAFTAAGLAYDPYLTFIASIPYRFYPLLALVFGLTIALSRRDLGPMLTAERRAFSTGQVIAEGDTALADYEQEGLGPPEGIRHRAINALIPIGTVIAVTLAGLYVSGAAGLERADYPGLGAWLRAVTSNASSFNALSWAALSGAVVALVLAVGTRSISLGEAMKGFAGGMKAMLMALVVLTLAWAIGDVCTELHTADYLVGLTQGVLSPHLLPVLVFVLAAAVAFATGTSWATMSILIPLVIPILHGLATAAGHLPGQETYTALLLGTVSSVLAGAVWGDHCSPISDTTILSSMGSGCDHIAHVRTQLPYALGIGVLGMALGDIPTAYGLSPWVSLLVAVVVIVGGVLWWGKTADSTD
jgi:Na+/H+ antiporter NhaC